MNAISVIVPTYNCAAYIQDALISIVNQTVPAHEIIIVDDGSTDNTEQIVKNLNIPTVVYVKQINSGVSKARNVGLQKASGDYIAFLDADDLWLPTMLAEQSRVLDKYSDVAFCFTNFIRFNDSTKERLSEQFEFYPELKAISVIPTQYDEVSIIKNDGFCSLINFGEFPGFTQAILFRRKALSGITFNEQLKVCEDAAFVLSVSMAGKTAYNKNVLLEVRRHESNTTKNISLIALDKLNAIKSLYINENLTTAQKKALDKRTTKAYLDAAICIKKCNGTAKAIKFYCPAFKIEGYILEKLKGIIKLLLLFRS